MTSKLILSSSDLSVQLPNLVKFIKKHSNYKLAEIYNYVAHNFGYESYNHLVKEHRVVRQFNTDRALYSQVCKLTQLIENKYPAETHSKCLEILNRFECIKFITNAFVCNTNVKILKSFYDTTLKYKEDYFFKVYDLTSVSHFFDINEIINRFNQFLISSNNDNLSDACFKLNIFQVPVTSNFNITLNDNNNSTIPHNEQQHRVLSMHNYCITELERYSSCRFLLLFSSSDRVLLSLFETFKSTDKLLCHLLALSPEDSRVISLISTCYTTQCNYTFSKNDISSANIHLSNMCHMLDRDIPSYFSHLMCESSYIKNTNTFDVAFTFAEEDKTDRLSDNVINPLDVINRKLINYSAWNAILINKNFLNKNSNYKNALKSVENGLNAYSGYMNEYKSGLNVNTVPMNIIDNYNKPISLETFTHGTYHPNKKQVKTAIFGSSGSGKSQLTLELVIGMMNRQQKGFIISTGYDDYEHIARLLNISSISINTDLLNVNLDLFQYIHSDQYDTAQIRLLTEYLKCVLNENISNNIDIDSLLSKNVYSSLSDFLTRNSLSVKNEFSNLTHITKLLDLDNNLVIFNLEEICRSTDFFDTVVNILLALFSLYQDRYLVIDAIYHLNANLDISQNWYCVYTSYHFNDIPFNLASRLDNIILLRLKREHIDRVLCDNTHFLYHLVNKYKTYILNAYATPTTGSAFLLFNLTLNTYDALKKYNISNEIVPLFMPVTSFTQTLGFYGYNKFKISTIHVLINEKPLTFTRMTELYKVLK